ncbi:hypothetical protein HFO56_24085 [Rhizobium laguerreae]|uniref:hypothetical protein n=1 Tax=Rhizobium laguerreae TaxID=1076926 RepID=UPI001C8FDEB0|nr:hypothetical protein [Rhizobium laguerreae]MBY3155409.1 hypothetical protein [Rhizobium laguerreae]
MTKSKTKFSYAQLALADWLAEDAANRFAVVATGHYSSKAISLYQVANGEVIAISSASRGCEDKTLLDRLGGSLEINYSPLVSEKVLVGNHSDFSRDDGNDNGFTNFMKSIGYKGFDDAHGGQLLMRQTDPSMQRWEMEWKDAFSALKDKRDDLRAKASRTVIIGAKCKVYARVDAETRKSLPAGFTLPIPDLTVVRPTWKARVVRETKDRLYIQDVVRIRDAGGAHREDNPIRGSDPNKYVDRIHAMVDGATERAAQTLLAVDTDRVEGYYQACDSALAVALGPLLTLHARLFQADGMHEDLMREAIEAATVKKD